MVGGGARYAYLFDADNADETSTHRTQYFEMMRDQEIYHEGWHEGWIASTKAIRPPCEITGAVSQAPAGFPWDQTPRGRCPRTASGVASLAEQDVCGEAR